MFWCAGCSGPSPNMKRPAALRSWGQWAQGHEAWVRSHTDRSHRNGDYGDFTLRLTFPRYLISPAKVAQPLIFGKRCGTTQNIGPTARLAKNRISMLERLPIPLNAIPRLSSRAYGSDLYHQCVTLREEILRKPLGLTLSYKEPADDSQRWHFCAPLRRTRHRLRVTQTFGGAAEANGSRRYSTRCELWDAAPALRRGSGLDKGAFV
jgi:hypothetical protein